MASSEHPGNYKCKNAFDGSTSSEWATQGEGSGSWIMATFAGCTQITAFKYQNRAAIEANKNVTLTFSQGAAQTFTMSETGLNTYAVSPQATTFVKITIDSHYTKVNNGARMITFIGASATSCTAGALPPFTNPGGAQQRVGAQCRGGACWREGRS